MLVQNWSKKRSAKGTRKQQKETKQEKEKRGKGDGEIGPGNSAVQMCRTAIISRSKNEEGKIQDRTFSLKIAFFNMSTSSSLGSARWSPNSNTRAMSMSDLRPMLSKNDPIGASLQKETPDPVKTKFQPFKSNSMQFCACCPLLTYMRQQLGGRDGRRRRHQCPKLPTMETVDDEVPSWLEQCATNAALRGLHVPMQLGRSITGALGPLPLTSYGLHGHLGLSEPCKHYHACMVSVTEFIRPNTINNVTKFMCNQLVHSHKLGQGAVTSMILGQTLWMISWIKCLDRAAQFMGSSPCTVFTRSCPTHP